MKSQDWADQDNNRSHAMNQLAEFCAQLGLSWNATEKKFTIELPSVEEMAVKPLVKTKKRLDISGWGPKGVDEAEIVNDPNMPDELPPVNEPLEEGKPPEGDEED